MKLKYTDSFEARPKQEDKQGIGIQRKLVAIVPLLACLPAFACLQMRSLAIKCTKWQRASNTFL